MTEHCINCFTGIAPCESSRAVAEGWEVQSPSPRRAECVFSGAVGQSTVIRVAAVVPLISCSGVPTPT